MKPGYRARWEQRHLISGQTFCSMESDILLPGRIRDIEDGGPIITSSKPLQYNRRGVVASMKPIVGEMEIRHEVGRPARFDPESSRARLSRSERVCSLGLTLCMAACPPFNGQKPCQSLSLLSLIFSPNTGDSSTPGYGSATNLLNWMPTETAWLHGLFALLLLPRHLLYRPFV